MSKIRKVNYESQLFIRIIAKQEKLINSLVFKREVVVTIMLGA
jgi:hypothetical protein